MAVRLLPGPASHRVPNRAKHPLVTEVLINYIEAAATHAPVWGLLIVITLMTIESSFIPFPSEVVMIPAGFLAARGSLTLGSPLADAVLAILAGVTGSLAGAYANYFLSLKLGAPFLERYGRYFFLPKPKLERAEEIFRTYGAGATFVCRLLPAIRQLISIPAGIARMPLASFTLWTGLGAGIWVTILTFLGYSLGAHTAKMTYAEIVHSGKATLSHNLPWILIACAVVFTGYVLVQKRVMRRSSPAGADGE
jgi:membrane protein DedA with SNARE-associated domain